MDAHTLDGTQTRGMKGQPYDWQQLLIPVEPAFTEALDDIVEADTVLDASR